jgi:hypothetical protein
MAAEAPATNGAKRTEPARRPLSIDQPCDVRWRGMRVGRGRIRVSMRENFDGEGSHLVRVESRLWGLFRRGLCSPANVTAQLSSPKSGDVPTGASGDDGARLEIATGNGHRPEVLVEGGAAPRAWLRLGGLRLVPEGQPASAWPETDAWCSTGNPACEQASPKSEETTPCAP